MSVKNKGSEFISAVTSIPSFITNGLGCKDDKSNIPLHPEASVICISQLLEVKPFIVKLSKVVPLLEVIVFKSIQLTVYGGLPPSISTFTEPSSDEAVGL